MNPDIPLLREVLNLPTAPLHEKHVFDFVVRFCRRIGLPVCSDTFGNLKVTYKKGTRSKPIAFLAHMDHPGFEIIRGGDRPIAQILGGVPLHRFLKAKVRLFDGEKYFTGRVLKIHHKKKQQYVIGLKTKIKKGSFGSFDLTGCRLQKGKIYTKAADNIVSVAALLNFLKVLVRRKQKTHVTCFFTRAEEIGLVGTQGMIQKRFLSPQIPLIVLEASSAKAGGVTIGGGPVLRVGDSLSTFSNEIDIGLRSIARKLVKKSRVFRYQRALLQGGWCEATAFSLAGYRVGCLAFPLGNYHNDGPKGYALEYIAQKDYRNMLRWLLEIAKEKNLSRAAPRFRKMLMPPFQKFSSRLKSVTER